jgi:hypothetical protein
VGALLTEVIAESVSCRDFGIRKGHEGVAYMVAPETTSVSFPALDVDKITAETISFPGWMQDVKYISLKSTCLIKFVLVSVVTNREFVGITYSCK